MQIAYLGLGSNIGDKKKYLYDALQLLNRHEGIRITRVSSLYETEPWGYKEQDLFMNLVVEIETSLNPFELLEVCQLIESDLGRIREMKWGPRVIDVDILLYGKENIMTERLIVPHPYMTDRDFVMIPLAEINPQYTIKGKQAHEWSKKFNAMAIKKVSHTLGE